MNVLIRNYETYTEALAEYRRLLASGHQAQMWLAYAGEGWRVSAPAASGGVRA